MGQYYYTEEPIGGLESDELDPLAIDTPSHEELIVLCIDTSNSMQSRVASPKAPNALSDQMRPESVDPPYTRTGEVIDHLFDREGLFARLQVSANRAAFWTMAVIFDASAETLFPAAKLVNDEGQFFVLENSSITRSRLHRWGKATSIASALRLADEHASNWLVDRLKATGNSKQFITYLIISDGGDNDKKGAAQAQALRIAKQDNPLLPVVGNMVTRPQKIIACAAYGDDGEGEANWELLRQIASEPRYFRRCETGAQMRDFLLASVSLAESRLN